MIAGATNSRRYDHDAPYADHGHAHVICEDIDVALPVGFALRSGDAIAHNSIRVRLHGVRNGRPVVVLGGISASRVVASHGNDKGWWPKIAGVGHAIDPEADLVIGIDFAPAYAPTPVTITPRDQASILKICLDALIEEPVTIIGASYGGMIALAFAELYPRDVKNILVIGASHRAHPFGTALRGVQRRIVDFAYEAGHLSDGVSLARQIGMISYRSPLEFDDRFGNETANAVGDRFDVCEYLCARGAAFSMTAERFISLSHSIDLHRIDPTKITVPTTLIAIESDLIAPPSDVEVLRDGLSGPVQYHCIQSRFGHDGFIKETETIAPLIDDFLASTP